MVSVVSGAVWLTSRFGFDSIGFVTFLYTFVIGVERQKMFARPGRQATRHSLCHHVHETYEFDELTHPKKFLIVGMIFVESLYRIP